MIYKHRNDRCLSLRRTEESVLEANKMEFQLWLTISLSVMYFGQSMSQNVIRQPIPNDCNRFYETRLLSCPPEFYWNSELNQCKLQAPAGCYFTSPVPNWSGSFHNDSKPSPVAVQESHNLMEVCDKKLGQRIVYPGDCTRFIMCDFLPFVMSCPQYLFWNSHLLTCDKICV